MLRLDQLAELHRAGGPLCLALGVFDGVHVGHQAVIQAAVGAACACGGVAGVLTFDPHPIRVLAPAKAPRRLLASLDHKAAILRELGVGVMCVVRFDEEFSRMESEEFVVRLAAGAGDLRLVAVGEDWRFGHGRRGEVELLRQAGESAGFEVVAVPPVMMDGERVSSTRIRQAIRDGSLAGAARMLGRPYAVAGVVAEGRRLGRQLGFPTANLGVSDEQLPPEGVWVVEVRIGGSAVPRHGVANLGCRPTVEESDSRTLEVHLLDFDGDLYGVWIEVVFRRFLREERKFGSLEELKQQIARDVAAASRDQGAGR